uniref:Uncharacterized protein n=1 Tax=Streptomyces sp. NBC_00003 TaxID=2903608 RepID=A0AAU2VBQ2_9ACTN
MPCIHTDVSYYDASTLMSNLLPDAHDLPQLASHARAMRRLAWDPAESAVWWIQEGRDGFDLYEESPASAVNVLLARLPSGWADDQAAREELRRLLAAAGYGPQQATARISEHEALADFWRTIRPELAARA